jgi:glycerol-3-phosphate acyltransferase PlsY
VSRAILLVAGAYLAGSLSLSLVLVRLLRRADLRSLGSGNPGATNVLRTSGGWAALGVLAFDVAKGLVPVELARRLAVPPAVVAATALAAVVGHVFPVFFGFRGGKGVATGLGALVVLFPLAGLAALAVFAAVLAATRIVSLASLLATAAVVPLAWGLGASELAPRPAPAALVLAAICAVLVVARHSGNLRRLAAGTERRLGERRAAE